MMLGGRKGGAIRQAENLWSMGGVEDIYIVLEYNSIKSALSKVSWRNGSALVFGPR
jgi:hypothetical protein